MADTQTLPAAFYDSRLLTVKQLEEMMGIKKSAIYNLLRNKTDPIPSVKIGKHRRFKLDKVLWWIEKHEA